MNECMNSVCCRNKDQMFELDIYTAARQKFQTTGNTENNKTTNSAIEISDINYASNTIHNNSNNSASNYRR